MKLFVLLMLMASFAHGVVLFEEVAGSTDLGEDHLDPIILTAQPGENEIIGSLAGGMLDIDLFTLRVPVGYEVTSLRVLGFSGGDNGSFLGGRPGLTLGASPFEYVNGDAALMGMQLNYVLISAGLATTQMNILPQFVVGPPISGEATLGAGDYAFWLNENTVASEYHFSFGVTPVPEPSVFALGSVLIFSFLRKRR